MRIAICDDVSTDRQALIQYINKYIGENYAKDVDIREYNCAEALLADKIVPTLLFLDIYMQGINGMEAAKQLLARGYSGGIVFTSATSEFGAASYDLNALDYLVKPFTYGRFLKTIKKCDESLNATLATIPVRSGRQNIKLFLREILYIETGSHCVLFHTLRETIKSPMTMSEVEIRLSKHSSFIRCHRSYIINLNAVEDVNQVSVTLINGDTVLLNTKNAVSLRRKIANYIWRGMELKYD